MMHTLSWQQYFMTMAYLVAMKSKDPSTKVGAVIVGPDKEIRSTGYNGLPRNFKDTEERHSRPLKYKLMNHAEENAILHCARIGVSAKNCSIYVPWIPCSLCAKSIIQSGITEVIYHAPWPGNLLNDTIWWESIQLSKEMFSETGVLLTEYKGSLINIEGMYQAKSFPLSEENS